MNTKIYEQTVIDHLPLARKIAAKRKRNIPAQVSLDELRSAAYMGLVDASKRYDGTQVFANFAIPRIEGAITDYLRELRWGSRRSPVKTQGVEDRGQEACEYDDLFEVVSKPANARVRNILRQHFMEGESQTDIASSLGVTRQSVSQSIQAFVADARSRWPEYRLVG